MASVLKIITEKCSWTNTLEIPVHLSEKIENKNFVISIFSASNKSAIRITLVNSDLITDHFTAIIEEKDFNLMKEMQELLIIFSDFEKQLKLLLDHCVQGQLKVKLNLSQVINLTFYNTCKVRELTVLSIPLIKTNAEDMIQFLKHRGDKMEGSVKDYIERNSVLQDKLNQEKELNLKHQLTIENLNDQVKYLEQIMEEKNVDLENVAVIIKDLNQKLKTSDAEVVKLTEENEKIALELEKTIQSLNSAKEVLNAYTNKFESYRTKMAQVKSSTVSVAKYKQTIHVFSKLLADLLLCQVEMKNAVAQSKYSESLSSILWLELNKCINMINELNRELKEVKTLNNITNDPLSEMIKLLELKVADQDDDDDTDEDTDDDEDNVENDIDENGVEENDDDEELDDDDIYSSEEQDN